jgi:hypothetical protein
MFKINNEDNSISMTRGDIAFFGVTLTDKSDNEVLFQAGDLIRITVYEKKDCEKVVLKKDFYINEESEIAEIYLTKDDTRFGDVISKPTDYWYEVELNPDTMPQTIIGYDEDGPILFRLYPEGDNTYSKQALDVKEISVVDDELDLQSERPVKNKVVARALLSIDQTLNEIKAMLLQNE